MQATRQSILKLESPAEAFTGSVKVLFDYSVVIFEPPYSLTQTVTQTRKRLESIRRTQWIAHRAESTQKRRKALDSNAFRPSSYLHTQEVTGSSPAVSTKKLLISLEIRSFFAYMVRKSDAAFLRFLLDPNADSKAEMTGEERIALSAPLPLFFCVYIA